jgi:hypothetical protein
MTKLLAIGAAILASASILAPGVPAQTSRTAAACGPRVSLLLWPKGYQAYPVPNVEAFGGWSGPFGVSNLLAYAAATRDGTLGYPASDVSPYCVGTSDKLTPGRAMTGRASGPVRLACKFPGSLVVRVDKLAGTRKRVRVALSSNGQVVADATVAPRASRIVYSKTYCKARTPLIEPTT